MQQKITQLRRRMWRRRAKSTYNPILTARGKWGETAGRDKMKAITFKNKVLCYNSDRSLYLVLGGLVLMHPMNREMCLNSQGVAERCPTELLTSEPKRGSSHSSSSAA